MLNNLILEGMIFVCVYGDVFVGDNFCCFSVYFDVEVQLYDDWDEIEVCFEDVLE